MYRSSIRNIRILVKPGFCDLLSNYTDYRESLMRISKRLNSMHFNIIYRFYVSMFITFNLCE